jgi:hypothetical protein
LLATVPNPTRDQRTLVDRAASLQLAIEQVEVRIANGEPYDGDLLLRLNGCLARLMRQLRANGAAAPVRRHENEITSLDQLEPPPYDTEPHAPSRPSRHALALLDADERASRVFVGNDDQPGIAKNAKRDRALARKGTGPSGDGKVRPTIRRHRIKGAGR